MLERSNAANFGVNSAMHPLLRWGAQDPEVGWQKGFLLPSFPLYVFRDLEPFTTF